MTCSLCGMTIVDDAQPIYSNSRYWIYRVGDRVHQVSRVAVTRAVTKTKKLEIVEPEPELIGGGEFGAPDVTWVDMQAA